MTAIEAIKFNHDAGGVIHDAVNIRKNAAEFIAVPGVAAFHQRQSGGLPAVYAVEPTKGRPVRIQVSLSSTNPSVAFIEVRVRRHVHKRAVNFTNGKSGFVAFELIDPPAARGRVGISDVAKLPCNPTRKVGSALAAWQSPEEEFHSEMQSGDWPRKPST